MKLEMVEVRLDELRPAEYNPRAATKDEYQDVKDSIKEFSIVEPIICNKNPERKNVIIGGHLRYKIMQELGYEKTQAIYVDLSAEKERRLNLRLNKNRGHWDLDMLANFNPDELTGAGFKPDELDIIFDGLDIEDEFNVEQAERMVKSPETVKGQIIQLGNHRLMCGDATSKDDMDKLMNSTEADLVFCDPPYNVDYEGEKHGKIMNDNMGEQEFVDFTLLFMARIRKALKPGGVYYICSGYSSYPIFIYAIKATGMIFSTPIIWVKNLTSFGWGDYKLKHEMVLKGRSTSNKKKTASPILYGWNAGKHYFIDSKYEADVWDIKRRASNTMAHPTQKPLELISRAIKNSTKRGELVLDLFAGSGSTLIAAEQEGRISYNMELDPRYCDIIKQRWDFFTRHSEKGILPEVERVTV